MPIVAGSLPKLTDGVSQQAVTLRLNTAMAHQKNAWLSVVTGNQKRPPAKTIKYMGANENAGLSTTLIERFDGKSFIVVIKSNDIRVFNAKTGEQKVVHLPNGLAYLNSQAPSDYSYVTVADTTFICNKNVKVRNYGIRETPERLNPSLFWSIFVKEAVPNANYAIYVNGVRITYMVTQSNVDKKTILQRTSTIANTLATGLNKAGYGGWTINNSCITVPMPAGYKVETSDGDGGQSMEVFGAEIENFSKLPPSCREHRVVKVKGDAGDHGDDYYVVYQNNLWRETWGWETKSAFDPSTMPHVLVYNEATDQFTFKQHVWKERVVGDNETNPHPAFVNQTINSMTLYKGRLVLLSGENVIMSEADNYENFYRSTVIQLLDNELIDIAAVTGRQANLFHGLQFNKKLLVFSDKSQFILDAGQTLSPRSASLVAASAYDCSRSIPPIAMDSSVYFTEDSSKWAKLYEYKVADDGMTEEADVTSIQVPEYIPAPIKALVGVPKASTIFLLGDNDYRLYVYKYLDGPQGKIQSAWNYWEFGFQIKSLLVSGSTLFLFVNRNDGMYLMSIDLDDDAVRSAYDLTVYLDSQITNNDCSHKYDPISNTTHFILPYQYDPTRLRIVAKDAELRAVGYYPKLHLLGANQFLVQGNWETVDAIIGETYDYEMEFSPFILREAKQNATGAIQDGVLSIRYFSLNYEDTSAFKVEVIGKDNQPRFVGDFTSFVWGDDNTILDVVPLDSGEFRFPVFEDGRHVKIRVTNDTPFHSCFSSAEWYGQWTPKAKQRF
jgi:hypothetical protein